MKHIIFTEKAPAPIGPYTQAVKAGNTLYVSGQIPVNPATGEVVKGIEAATEQVMENLKAILTEAGATFENVVKTTIFLADNGAICTSKWRICTLFQRGNSTRTRNCTSSTIA